MISRTIQGKADERMDGYFDIGKYLSVVTTPVTLDPNNTCIAYNNPNYGYSSSQYTFETANGGKDSEPDIFSFSVGGYSGKFYIEVDMTNDNVVNGKAITIPKQDIKIDYTLDGNGSNIKRLSKFTITTPNGVKYEFGKIDGDVNDGIEITKPYNAQVDQYTSGWYLRRVTTPDDKSKIILKYAPEKYRYGFRASTGGSSNNTIVSTSGSYNESTLDIIGYRLKSIENATGTNIAYFLTGLARPDLNIMPGFDADKAKRLSEISIANGTLCKKFVLSQDTFIDNTIYKSNQYTDYRLRLKSVQESECTTTNPVTVPAYEFTYYNNGDINFLPNRLSSAIDHWGYYNGATSNPTSGYNIPFTRLQYTNTDNEAIDVSQGFSNRETDEAAMKLGTLQQIKYPTGGTATFEYEANSYLTGINEGLKTLVPINNFAAFWHTGYFSETPGQQQASTSLVVTFDEISNTFFKWDYKKAQNYSPGSANISNNPSSVSIKVYQGNWTLPIPSNVTALDTRSVSNSADDQIINNVSDKLLYLFPTLQSNVQYTFVLTVANAASRIFFDKEITSPPYNRKVGGLRIAKVTTYDGVNSANNIVKTYSYNKWTSVSSGKLYNKPVYGYVFDNVIAACNPDINTSGERFKSHYFSDNSIVPLSSFEGYHIGYEQVTESINGLLTQYFYDMEAAEEFTVLPRVPEQPRIKTGQLLKKEQIDANNQTVSEETNLAKEEPYENGQGTYIKLNNFMFSGSSGIVNSIGGTLTGTQYTFVHISKVGNTYTPTTYSTTVYEYTPAGAVSQGSAVSITFWKKYNIRTRPYRISKVENITNNITTTTNYAYDSQNRFLAPTEVTTTNSENKTYTTKTYYSRNLPSLHPNLGIKDTFENKFMIGIPLQQDVYINGIKRGGSVLEYKTYTGTGYSYLDFYPYRSYSFNRDSARKLLVTVDAYDRGLPKQMTHISSVTPQIFTWDAYKRLTNKNYGTLNWGVGYYSTSNLVQYVSDENGLMTKYTYDSLWRLSITQNRFDGTMTSPTNVQATTIYDYHYKNGAADYNYVGTSTSFINASNTTPLSTKQYMDGLGRPLEVVKENYTPNGQQQKNYVSYDALGRQNKTFLPFESSSLGFEAASNYFSVHPYVLTEFEPSPLSRPIKQTNVDGTTVLSSYGTNTTSEVRLFSVPTEGSVSSNSYYPLNFLYKTTMTDENNKPTCVFKDKLGRVVLTRKLLNNKRVDTYNVYDDFGQLTAVLPPGSVDSASGNVTYSLAFLYKYDNQNRLIEKKVPGADPQKFFYDKRDLLTLTQDGNMAHETPAKYLATQYDNLGRVLKTGWKFDTTGLWSGAITIADDDNKLTETQYYPNKSWVKHQGAKVLKPTGVTTNRNFVWSYIERRDGLTYTGNPIWTGKQHLLNPNMPERPILDADETGVDWSVSGYDGAQKPTLTLRYLFSGSSATEVRTYQTFAYDNGQRLTDQKYMYTLNGAGVSVPTFTLSNMNYNYKDQLIEKNIGYNNGNALQSIDYAYNLRGWLTNINSVNVYGNNNPIYTPESIGSGEIQNLMISPLVKQAMLDMTAIYRSNTPSKGTRGNTPSGGRGAEMSPINDNNADLFSEKMDYVSPDSRMNVPSQFNGNISAVTWHVAGRNNQGYGFKYDDLDRLTESTYFDISETYSGNQAFSNFSTDNKFKENVQYDVRGNITSLQRNGLNAGSWTSNGYTAATYGLIDSLAYSYDQPSSGQVNQSNQLLRITDNSIVTKGFKYANTRTASSDVDYTYDKNGNLTYDRHKGISEIRYNYLNLPMYIRIDDPQNAFIGGTIEFVYDASGVKLQKIVKDKNSGVSPVIYDYVNGVEYKDNVLQRIAHTEGSVSRQDDGSFLHEYVLRDHLGNTRVTFTDANNDGTVGESDIKQINNYYPFGLNMEGNWNGSFPEAKNKYGYNEKELNTDFGLNWNDYGARFYDPAMARWLAVDPMAEKMRWHSPYSYAFDNPIKYVDHKGLYPILTITNEQTGYTAMKFYGKAHTYPAVVIVPTYKAVLTEVVNGKITKLAEYNVTRDGWYNLGSKDGEKQLENRGFEPTKKVAKYTADKFTYNGDAPALALRTTDKLGNKSDKLDATPLNTHTYNDGTPLDPAVNRLDANIARGVMVHIGGVYKKADGEITLAGTYGCMGVINPLNVKQTKEEANKWGELKDNFSNEIMEDLSKRIDESSARDPASKGKIEVIINKRE